MGPTQLDIKIIKENPTLATEINKAIQTLMSILKTVSLPRAAIPHGHMPVGIVGAGDGSPEGNGSVVYILSKKGDDSKITPILFRAVNKLNDQSVPTNEINSLVLTGFLIQECLQTIYESMTAEERLNFRVFILGDNVPMAQAMNGVSNSPIIKNAAVKIRTTLRAISNRYKVPVHVGYIPTAQNFPPT